MSSETVMKNRIPFPFAVCITVTLALIPGLFFGKWNFTLWISFIAWAEYFVFGAKPDVARFMLPALAFGSASAAIWMANWVFFENLFNTNYSSTLVSWLILGTTDFIWVLGLCYAIEKIKLFNNAGLAMFNGLTLFLAVYFTTLGGAVNAVPQVGPLDNPYFLVFWCFVWNTLMAWFGWVLGVFNMWVTFPYKVKAKAGVAVAK